MKQSLVWGLALVSASLLACGSSDDGAGGGSAGTSSGGTQSGGETGAPRYAVGEYVGGEEYSASYLVKAMTLGHAAGLLGIDWFAQGDGAAPGASMDAFDYMGLYFDYSQAAAVSETSITPQGKAYA